MYIFRLPVEVFEEAQLSPIEMKMPNFLLNVFPQTLEFSFRNRKYAFMTHSHCKIDDDELQCAGSDLRTRWSPVSGHNVVADRCILSLFYRGCLWRSVTIIHIKLL